MGAGAGDGVMMPYYLLCWCWCSLVLVLVLGLVLALALAVVLGGRCPLPLARLSKRSADIYIYIYMCHESEKVTPIASYLQHKPVSDRYAATSSDWDPTVRIQVQATKGKPKLKRLLPKHSRSVTRAAWNNAPDIRTSPYHRCLRLHATQVWRFCNFELAHQTCRPF